MVDLTTFAANPDNERFETTMQSTRTAGVKNLYLSNKGIPKYPYYQDLVNASERYISGNNNVKASLKETFGGSSPALSFFGEWASNSSHVLVYFELDNKDWLDNSPI